MDAKKSNAKTHVIRTIDLIQIFFLSWVPSKTELSNGTLIKNQAQLILNFRDDKPWQRIIRNGRNIYLRGGVPLEDFFCIPFQTLVQH